jgi:acyl carrier protein
MGLDGVELVLALEESFGVALTDEEAARSVTPAIIIDVIFGKLRASENQYCIAMRAFHLLRKAMVETLHIPRRSVTLSTDVRRFKAGKTDRQIWEELKTALHARRWPPLARPTWLVACLWFLSIGTFCALLISFNGGVAAVGGGAVAIVTSRGTRSFRVCIPSRCARVRSLVPFAATSEGISWTRAQVAALVRKVVIEQLALQEGQYREDARFVEDLKLDQ